VTGLLEKQPFRRYTIEQALAHPWVRGETAREEPLERGVVESMLNFNANNKMRREALKLVSSTLSAADLRRLRAVFHGIDTNVDMTISGAELADALHKLGLGSVGTEVEQLVKAIDQDGNGVIDLAEFLTATSELQVRAGSMAWPRADVAPRERLPPMCCHSTAAPRAHSDAYIR